MVRNLKMENGAPLRPERCCRKKTGPGEVSLISSAMTSIGSANTRRAARAPKKSSVSFASICQDVSGAERNTISGCPNISSRLARAICGAKKSAASHASTPSISQSWMTLSTRSKLACLALRRTLLTECSCSSSISSGRGASARLNSPTISISSPAWAWINCRSRAVSGRFPARMTRRRYCAMAMRLCRAASSNSSFNHTSVQLKTMKMNDTPRGAGVRK
jgi:hypothetical protein